MFDWDNDIPSLEKDYKEQWTPGRQFYEFMVSFGFVEQGALF